MASKVGFESVLRNCGKFLLYGISIGALPLSGATAQNSVSPSVPPPIVTGPTTSPLTPRATPNPATGGSASGGPKAVKPSTAQQIEQLQRQIDQLRADTGNSKAPAKPSSENPPVVANKSPDVANKSQGDTKNASLSSMLNSAAKPAEKKFPETKFTGFFHLDSAFFSQSDLSRATLGDIQDGTGFRRARLAASVNLSERSSMLLEFDFAQSQARFVDVWGQVKGTPLGTMRIGRFRQPFGMTELTGIREIAFMERPTIVAMSPFRQTGIMFSDVSESERMTYAVSVFRNFSDNFGNIYGEDGGYGTAERFTFLLRDDGDDAGVTHVGFGHSYLNPGRDQLQIASQDEVFIGQQPNLGPAGLSVFPIVNVPPFVNTGVFNVEHANLFNLEAAMSRGNKLIQSEYRWTNLELPSGDSATVHGGYITGRYVLTGETIPYNRTVGVFGRLKPNNPVDLAMGKWGAWEVATQISSLNLNPLFGLPGIPGPTRRLASGTLALNWYWNDNAKCQFEWVNGSLNDPLLGDSSSNTIAARFQMDF